MVAHIISAENIVATYLSFHPEKNEIKYQIIYEIKKKLEDAFRKQQVFVYVDNTKLAICNMIDTSSYLFTLDNKDDKITLKDRKKFDADIPYFNAKIDGEIRKTYLELMKTICKDMK